MKILILLPNLLHEEAAFTFQIPPLDALIAESEKGGYTYLKKASLPKVPTYLLNEHTKNLDELLQIPEEKVGLISDAGVPCLADPGSELVFKARQKGIQIEAIPGPSSIPLALMLSGLPAQAFTFHGYLSREEKELEKQIRSFPKKMTQIFIEAPYRNQKLLDFLLKHLRPDDLLSIAWDLTGPNQGVISQPVRAWKNLPDIHKKPAVFLVYLV